MDTKQIKLNTTTWREMFRPGLIFVPLLFQSVLCLWSAGLKSCSAEV